MKRGGITKTIPGVIILSMFILFALCGSVFAGGPFGPPQPLSKEAGGLRTAVGYWHYEDTWKDGADHVIRQNQVYSEVAYGAGKVWEIYGRIGISNLRMVDAFQSTQSSTTTAKDEFEESWKMFGTLGAKGFYPFNKTFGLGTFVQGTYFFRDADDNVSGTRSGTPYTTELVVKNRWDVNFGLGFQASLWRDTKLYAGPFVYYAEAKTSPTPAIAGLQLADRETTIKNKTNFGGFAGFDVPLAKGFHLNVEGQYSERLSAGAAISLVY